MKRLSQNILMVIALLLSSLSSALAAPCQGNQWQPTFVHDLERPDGPWYVHASGMFTKLQGGSQQAWNNHACALIQREGVRNRAGYTNCQSYTRIQCGCTRRINSNSTCNNFLRNRR